MSDVERNEHDANSRGAAADPATEADAGAAGSAGASLDHRLESTPGRRRAHKPGSPTPGKGKRILKWAAFIIGLFFFLAVLREAMDPFGDDPYVAISHGDHVHYVPEDRDPNVPVSRFPTTEPAADERITPDGRVVKKE